MAFGIDDAIAVGLKLIDKWFPTPEEKLKAQAELFTMRQKGELAALAADVASVTGQTEINKEEAKSADPFVSRWRPFIGWTCGAAFASNYVLMPLLSFGSTALGHPLSVPPLDMAEMLPVLLGMLGLGGFRTFEKVRGAT